jgi:hypothetical protein
MAVIALKLTDLLSIWQLGKRLLDVTTGSLAESWRIGNLTKKENLNALHDHG